MAPKKEIGIPNATQNEILRFKKSPRTTRTRTKPMIPFFVRISIL